jgi:hypothetical protein
MPFLRGLVVAALLLAGIAAQDVDRARVDRVLEQSRCQTELPGEARAVGGGGRPPESAPRPVRRGERSGGSGGAGSPFGALSLLPFGLATVVFWAVIVLGAALLVAAIVRSWRGRREPAVRPATVRARSRPVHEEPPVPVPDHERLAAAGDFAAALRALLQHALAAWSARGGGLPVHATGREALRLVRTKLAATESLAHLVTAVERVHFGGRPADRAQYDASRLHLQQWEVACRQPQ